MQRVSEIRQVVQEHGHQGYLRFQHDLLEGKTLPNGVKIKRNPTDFSLRALWEGLVGPVEDTLPNAGGRGGFIETQLTAEEAVGTASFASATGQLIAATVIQGYDSVPRIGDRLVTIMPSNLRDERVVGFTHLQGPKTVAEGEAYEDSEFADKYVTTTQSKKGRILSITEEAVTFDQTGQILMRASGLGRVTAEERERVIVRGVADVDSATRVYRPSGTGEQLYAAGNNNLLSTATPLNDWEDFQAVMAYHAANVTDDRAADDENAAYPITWRPRQILVAEELRGTAIRIVSSGINSTAPGDTDTANMQTGNMAVQVVGGTLEVLSSPYLDEAAAASADQYGDASDWFLGNFPDQFVWKEIWPLQTLRAPASDPENFDRDIVARFKVRYYGGINAIDERHVVQVNAA